VRARDVCRSTYGRRVSEADNDEAAAVRRLRRILATPLPGGHAVLPGGSAAVPGGSAAVPGGSAAVPGGPASVPGGHAALDGGPAAPDGGHAPASNGHASAFGATGPLSLSPSAPGSELTHGSGPPLGQDDAAESGGEAPAGPGGAHRAVRLGGPSVFDPGRRGVRALAVVAALVVLIAAFLAWRARPRPEPVPAPAPALVGAPAAADAGPSATPDAQSEVVVAVAGKVRRPGLVRLPAGARVADAISAAGGALPGTDVSFLNLARKVTDGELILVGVTAPPGAAGQVGAASAGGAPAGAPDGKVNLNTATAAQLDSLPGVGPVLAQRIVDHRERQGGFRSVADLRQVDGIGDARFEQLKELVTV